MVPEIKTVIKKYFVCPNCGQHEFSYGHLTIGQSFGPWGCDHCGHGYTGKVTADTVEIEPHQQKTVKLMALLKFAPELADESEPVHIMLKRVELIFLVKGIRTFCSLELKEMSMTRAILESIACFLGSNRYVTFNYDGSTHRYCPCGKLQVYQDGGYKKRLSDCVDVDIDFIIPPKMSKEIRAALSHTRYESIAEYSRTQTRREQMIRIINKDVIPKLHMSDELPISFKQIELFDNEITDIQMFIRLMIESGYVCCTENDLIMIGLPEKC